MSRPVCIPKDHRDRLNLQTDHPCLFGTRTQRRCVRHRPLANPIYRQSRSLLLGTQRLDPGRSRDRPTSSPFGRPTNGFLSCSPRRGELSCRTERSRGSRNEPTASDDHQGRVEIRRHRSLPHRTLATDAGRRLGLSAKSSASEAFAIPHPSRLAAREHARSPRQS